MKSSAPAYAPNDGVIDVAEKTLGGRVLSSLEAAYEVSFTVDRESLVETMTLLRDTPGLEYQQLMEIAGVDYPERPDRFEVVYCLLSLTRNHRIRVHVQTDEVKPVPSVTHAPADVFGSIAFLSNRFCQLPLDFSSVPAVAVSPSAVAKRDTAKSRTAYSSVFDAVWLSPGPDDGT